VVGCGGVVAVGADHAGAAGDCLAGSVVAPGRPARAGAARPGVGGWPGAGGSERDHGGGGAGQPPAPPPGGLAVAGLRVGPVGGRVGRGVYGLWAAGAPRRPPGRPRACPALARCQRHRADVDQLCAAAYSDRVAALASLALVGSPDWDGGGYAAGGAGGG
jgi:hypothetical protein